MLFERGDRKLFPRFKQKLCYASLFSQDLMFFLAHLAKAKVSFWHLASRPLTFHILIFSSEIP
jgi:hypothetical protein